MSADALLSRLNKVKTLGPSRWKACCPAHDDRHPSLYITEKSCGTLLLHCLSNGCGALDVIAVVGLDPSELFPPKEIERKSPIRNPVFQSDLFELIRFEVSIVNVIACDMHKNRSISEQDYQRLGVALSRLERIAEAAYGSR